MEKSLISVDNLSFSYKNNNVLKSCSFNILEGTINSLIGINGVGKTTVFNCLIKELQYSKGYIYYNERDLKYISYKELAKLVSFVPQLSSLGEIDCSVRDYLVEGRTPYLKPFSIPTKDDYLLVEKYANEMEIEHLLGANVMNLSGGQVQLVSIARALIQETPIIIMDEPMSALDLKNQAIVLKLIMALNKRDKTIIFTTHNPNHAIAINCNVLILANGEIYKSGSADNVLTNSTINKIYGDDFERNGCGFIQIKKI